MKTNLLLSLALLACAPLARAADAAPHACCAAPAPAAAAPLSDRSLYQLDATWTDDAGAPFQLASLRGRPVVLAMFFASCTYACPALIADVQRIRAALPDAVRERAAIILVSFDPARDTPAALHAYRDRLRLDASWTLLHGAPADVQELAMLLGVKYRQDARGDFSHSNLITILNPAGEIAHQRSGLQGGIAEAAQALTLASR